MSTEYIKDFYGKILGWIDTDSMGNQTAYDFDTRQVLGYYKVSSGYTTDFYGKMLTKGNTVSHLIMKKHNL